MKAAKLLLLLMIAVCMACEPGDMTRVKNQTGSAQDYLYADEGIDEQTEPVDDSDPGSAPEALEESVDDGDESSESEEYEDSVLGSDDAAEWDATDGDKPDIMDALYPDVEAEPITDDTVLHVPVRFHDLVGAPGIVPWPSCDGQLDDQLDAINALWSQSNIRFVWDGHEQTVATPAGQEAFSLSAYHEGWAVEALTGLVDTQELEASVWHVFMYAEFGPPGSAYYSEEIGAVFLSMGPIAYQIMYEPVILAHELGHSLGLTDLHGPGTETNIMGLPDYSHLVGDTPKVNNGGSGALLSYTELTPEQITTARAQVIAGGAYTVE